MFYSPCLGTVSGHWSLFNGELHTIRIEYTLSPESLLIYLDNDTTPILNIPFKLKTLLQLDAGRAWIGFISGTGKEIRHIYSSTSIETWEFKEILTNSNSILGWRHLCMEYKIEPPSNLILLRESFDRYNSLFQLLFNIKRVQYELQHCWQSIMNIK